MNHHRFTWYEFFAGGGMARLGLGNRWDCIFANEWCPKKAAAYRAYFGESPELREADVKKLTLADMPGTPDLVWASFPCQDLSLAGMGAGLQGERSGTFAPFWKLIQRMITDGRRPRIIALENVAGTLTSHRGEDFATILRLMLLRGYRPGALVMDALKFVPQSRPRLFIIAVDGEAVIPGRVHSAWPTIPWHTPTLLEAYAALPREIQRGWVWWKMPRPTHSVSPLSELIEVEPTGVKWHPAGETRHLLSMMSVVNRAKVKQVSATGERRIGTLYRRTRPGPDGIKTQRAEVRFDDVAGCLRTPVGGSSRQTVLVVEGKNIRSRLLSPREAARLMGVPEAYPIPMNYNDAYHLFGDGVAVPVVRWLERHLLRPLATADAGDRLTAKVA